MAEFAQRLRLDLTNAFAGHVEQAADFLEGTAVPVGKAEPEVHDLPLAVRQRVENLTQAFLEQMPLGDLKGIFARQVRDEIAIMRVIIVANLRLQRNRLLGHALDGTHLVNGDVHLLRQLQLVRLATELLDQPLLDTHELVNGLDHVHGDADRARLVGDRTRRRLTNPPRGIGRKLVAPLVLELLNRLHEAGVALLDEVEEREPAIHVLLDDRNDETEVRLDHLRTGDLSGLQHLAELGERRHELLSGHAEKRL